MLNLLGEYHAKLDAKGRAMLPVALRKQLGDELVANGFVLNRDVFESCLVLYPLKEWDVLSQKIRKLNRFVRKNAEFIRRFTSGATPIEIDSSARLSITKPLADYASLGKDLVFVGSGERIEIWAKEAYENMLSSDYDFSAMSEDVMGAFGNETEGSDEY